MREMIREDFGGVLVGLIRAETASSESPLLTNGKASSGVYEGLQETTAWGAKGVATLKETVRSVASSFSDELNKLAPDCAPDEITLELGLTLGTDGWFFGLKGEGTAQLSLKWIGSSQKESSKS